jgi:hypothetical protein
MAKQIIMSFVWKFVLYMGACCVTGAIAGGIAGSNDPEHAAEAGARAGQQAVFALRGYFLLGSLGLSVVGASLGILPGTRMKPVDSAY